jgi:hypothetical protein
MMESLQIHTQIPKLGFGPGFWSRSIELLLLYIDVAERPCGSTHGILDLGPRPQNPHL